VSFRGYSRFQNGLYFAIPNNQAARLLILPPSRPYLAVLNNTPIFWLTQFFPRTNSRVNQGVGVHLFSENAAFVN